MFDKADLSFTKTSSEFETKTVCKRGFEVDNERSLFENDSALWRRNKMPPSWLAISILTMVTRLRLAQGSSASKCNLFSWTKSDLMSTQLMVTGGLNQTAKLFWNMRIGRTSRTASRETAYAETYVWYWRMATKSVTASPRRWRTLSFDDTVS